MRRRWMIMMLCLLPLAAEGQELPLAGGEGWRLWLPVDRVWSYNLYEHSRWGAGLGYTRLTGHRWLTVEGYAGYGMRDEKWKWGLTTSLANRHRTSGWHLSAIYDLEAAASRRMGSASVVQPTGYTTFANQRMIHVEQVAAGWTGQRKSWTLGVELKVGFEQRLFDGEGVIYPESYYRSGQKTLYNYTELSFVVENERGVKLRLTAGRTEESEGCMPDVYVRALAQYAERLRFKWLSVESYVQAGWCDGSEHRVAYSRMFDLGGTVGVPFRFDHTLLTVAPCELTANVFALASVRVGVSKPVFEWWDDVMHIGLGPRPMVEVTAAWGRLWGQDEAGMLRHEGLLLQSPHRGVVEVVAGVDGLVRWGVTEWGVAMGWQVWPATVRVLVFSVALMEW